ncbi:MAG: hypothetical protein ACLFMT_04890 [Halobacteriales archaeon]
MTRHIMASDTPPAPDEKTRSNRVIQALRERGPLVADELPRKISTTDRRWVGKFDVTRSGTGAHKSRGRTQTVYYLYGDERRAVRKYIEENTEFVASCMEDRVNPLNSSVEDYWWRMFCEEWVWGGHDSRSE